MTYKMNRVRACRKCCDKHNWGKYSDKFLLKYIKEVTYETETVGV